MPTIFVKDDLRASVEAASGGNTTVMYTEAGHPSIMCRVPKFNLEDIDPALGNGLHPAFIVNGREVNELWIGQNPGIVKDGNLLSIPGVSATLMNFDDARQYAANNGPGWHLMTAAEMAAIAPWCEKNGTMPRGNDYYGRSNECPWETC
ncbi:MAG: hypothetical protein LBL69_06430, partial [Zoogloeaceae bacterium]|nr:hypothetical protein [Zoogloeaceae bacterium]